MSKYNTIVVADLHLVEPRYQHLEYEAWTVEMFQHTFTKINEIIVEFEISKIVIAGDYFDSPPKHSALILSDMFLSNLPECITERVIIGGNHTIMPSINGKVYYEDIMEEFFLKNYKVKNIGYEQIGDVLYCSHKHINKLEKLRKSTKLVYSHFRSGIQKVASDEIDITALNYHAELVILGDIHKRLAYDNIVYAGSPIDTHFGHYSEVEADCPSVLLLNEFTLEYAWKTTLSKDYRKKKLIYDSVKDFLSEVEELELEHQTFKTFFKVIIQDKKFNLKRFDQSVYEGFCKFSLEHIDINTDRENKEVVAQITDNLSQTSVSDNLLDFIENINTRPELVNELRALFATLERKI